MKRIFVLYKDNDARRWEHDAWSAYSFETSEEAAEFVKDLNSPESVWKDEAVMHITAEIEIPDTMLAVIAPPENEEDQDDDRYWSD